MRRQSVVKLPPFCGVAMYNSLLKMSESVAETLISAEYITFQLFEKKQGRVAEWSALQTGNRGYPSSIPAKIKTFFSEESKVFNFSIFSN